jgi:2-polyprenyl-6-methoxyphenol hydroxylase-like FAD-dependent oxidoreductase
MGAHVRELIVEDGIVRGVRYRSREGWAEVRALLTVAADGRSSTVRRLIGMEPVRTSPPMDVLWFRLPRFPGDTLGSGGQAARGRFIVRLRREDHWQIGYLFTKGSYQRLRAQGIEALRAAVTEAAPEFADRVDAVRDWKDVSLLSVESSRLRRWYAPGLLLIGDAAHVMSPVAGVGINYALQDAVAAADLLEAPLRAGRLSLRDLAAVQRRRELPTRVIQAFQRLIQRGLVAPMIAGRTPRTLPLVLGVVTRVPLLRQLPLRLIGYGLRPSLLPERFAVHRAPTPA